MSTNKNEVIKKAHDGQLQHVQEQDEKGTASLNLEQNKVIMGVVFKDEVFEEIINTFRQLYQKYIDSNRAIFMVNVSSANRNDLMQLFDTHYYNYNIKNNININSKDESRCNKTNTVKPSLLRKCTSHLLTNININTPEDVHMRSMINDQLRQHFLNVNVKY